MDDEQPSWSSSSDPTARERSKNFVHLEREIPAKVAADAYRRHVKWRIVRMGWDRHKVNGVVKKRILKKVPLVAAWQFQNWTDPNSPSYNKQMVDAIRNEDWNQLRLLCREQVSNLSAKQSIFGPGGKTSHHEIVIGDIFKLCGIPFSYQVDVEIPSGTGSAKHAIVDFVLGDGRYFEVFGVRWDMYRDRNEQKTVAFWNKLWFVNFMHSSTERDNVAMLGYARVLDHECCHKERCGMPLFSESLEKRLQQRVPLLMPKNFELCKSYVIQLTQMGAEGINKVRENITNQDVNKDTGEVNEWSPKKPPYLAPAQKPEIPVFKQIRRVSPTMWNRELAPEPEKVAQVVGRVGELPSLKQISSELGERYESVGMWSDAEKVAMYFQTPQALMQAMQSAPSQQPLRMVANWYGKMKHN